MSSNNGNADGGDSQTGNDGVRADELSRRMFVGGCFGLPWLWIVHTFYWHSQQRAADQALLDANEDPNNPTPAQLSDEEQLIAMKQRDWVRRGRNAAVLVVTIWAVWIVIVQVFLKDVLPDALFVRSENAADRTGW